MEREAKPKAAEASAERKAPRRRSGASSLERRLEEAREQQAATSEILRVISVSKTDVQPVFEAIAANALRLCDGRFCAVYHFDGTLIHLAAFRNLSPAGTAAFQRAYPCAPSRGGTTQRAILTRSIVHMPDVLKDPEYVYQDVADKADYRSVLAVPMLRDGAPLGAITVYRVAAEAFPDAQVDLLKTFADQAVIAIENVRLFTELQARNREATEALDQQTATSEVLKVISRSAFDLQPVLDTVIESAVRLCGAEHGHVHRYDGALLRLAAGYSAVPAMLDYLREHPAPLGPGSISGIAGLERRPVHWPDVLAQSGYQRGEAQKLGGYRTILAVPMLSADALLGVIVIWKTRVDPFTPKQIELVTTFADQAVIAVQNVRLFTELQARNRDLTEALEQQTATSDILRVISQSQTNVQPIFDAIVQSAVRLCDAVYSAALRLEGDYIHLFAHCNWSGEGLAMARRLFPMPVDQDHLTARAIRESRIIHVHNLQSDPTVPATSRELAVAQGYQTLLIVPMLREDRAIGAIVVANAEQPFSDSQVTLLQTFADQAVIAVENVRLFTELQVRNRDLTEALEQQTATSEILRVISQSQTNVQPVFETIASAALKLCGAGSANVFTFDGALIRLAALVNESPDYGEELRRFFPRPPGRETAVTRAIQTCSIVAIPDVVDDDEYAMRKASLAGGFRSVLAVPLVRDGAAIGGIAVGRREPGPFPESQVALLKTFADQAVIAIENVRLFKELEARTTELTRSVGELKALGEVGQAVSSTLDLETVLSTIVSRATHLAGMDGGSIYEYDERREEFHLRTADRLPAEMVDALRATPIRKGEGVLGRMAVTGEPVQIPDIGDERAYQSHVREILIRSGHRSLLAVPLLREDHLIGGLAVNRKSAGEFAPEVIDLLKNFATQSALAIQNARLFREIEDKSRQLEIASRHKSEFLANMSHELRTPLNAIIGFSEVLAERMFGEINDKQAEYLNDILESGRHLLALINDILDLSKIEAGRMELEPSEFNLPGAIENALILLRERAQRRAITLAHDVDEGIGTLRADERKVKQVLLNLLSNALKFTPEGGRIDVRARVRERMVEISVTDTGVGIAPADQAAVFEEFRQVGTSAKKSEGTGLGLAISRKFIELHGGRIWVDSAPGKGATFAFTLPLPATSQRDTAG